MTHVNDDDLVLHYYGEDNTEADVAGHLRVCADCANAYEQIARSLTRITVPVALEPDEAFWSGLPEHVAHRALEEERNRTLAIMVWLVPLLYPFSPRAIFRGAQLEHAQTGMGIAFVLLALMWALAGPFVALFALNRIQGSRIDRTQHRLVVYGALLATISAALFNLTSRTGLGLPLWYLVTGVVALSALLPISESTGSTKRLRKIHRLSALLIVIFAAAHLSNHTFAIINVSTHSTVLDLLRMVYRRPAIEMLLMAAIVMQLGTGGALIWQAHLRRPSVSTNVQALSGLYLAVFFLAHVSAVLVARPQTDTNFVWAAGQGGVLASRGSTFLLPYYILGVTALLVHVGQYLRSKVVGLMPEVSVRRLSYAGMAFGGMLVLTIGLALCGIRLVP